MTWNIGALRQNHDRFLKEQESMVAGVLYDAGLVAVAEVIAHPTFTPRTGGLQRATKSKIVRISNGRVVRISNAKAYARSLEEGAAPHRIVARNANTLRFIAKGGGVVYRRAVNHPGNKPYWFLRTAVNTASSRAERMLLNGMQRIARSRFGR